MRPEVLARVFEPFFTTKDVGKGTGLGLSMVYGFIHQSGGHVRIDSERGRGTTVTLYLPRAAEGQGADDEELPASGGLPRGSESVLIVEDDEQVRHFVVAQVRALGYRVIEAADGHGALAALACAPDTELLFTDVVMPGGMTGRQLAAEAQWICPGLKVLYTSGYNDNIIGREPEQIILRKPYGKAELARKLRQALDAGKEPGP
jgi:CheY-like chemotaxis protein